MSLRRKLSGATTVGVIGSAGRKGDAEKMTSELFYQMLTKLETVITKQFKLNLGKTHLISGGAAWADHLAVMLYIEGRVPALTLHLPAPLKDEDEPRFSEKEGDCGKHGKGETSIGQVAGKGAPKRGKKDTRGQGKEMDNARNTNERSITGKEVYSAALMANKYHEEFSKKMGESRVRKLKLEQLKSKQLTLGQLLMAKHMGANLKVHKGFMVRNSAVAEGSEYLVAFTWSDGDSPKHKGGTADTWKKYEKVHKNCVKCVHIPLSSLKGTDYSSAQERFEASILKFDDFIDDIGVDTSQDPDTDSGTSQTQLINSNTSGSLQADQGPLPSPHTDSSTSQSDPTSSETDLRQNVSPEKRKRKRIGCASSESPDPKRQNTSS